MGNNMKQEAGELEFGLQPTDIYLNPVSDLYNKYMVKKEEFVLCNITILNFIRYLQLKY